MQLNAKRCNLCWDIVGCPESLNFTYIPSVRGCYHVVLDKMQQAFANERCISIHPNSRLVIINSQAEQNELSDLLHKHRSKQLQ